ncbi:hypothetical protein [Prosthecobacter sp.]|uniref:hypothetical protein n=1 Tax=Prosthecobacter sp. TaxID=1965333 RepID=UPI003784A54A
MNFDVHDSKMLKLMRWVFVIPGNAKRGMLILVIATALVVAISLLFKWSGAGLVLIVAGVLIRYLDIRDYERQNAERDGSSEPRT